jgi:thiol-disulfide isomerase/thioredoxin
METSGPSTRLEEGAAPAPPAAPKRQGWQVRAALAALIACALLALFWPRGDGGPRGAAPGGFLLDASGRPSPLGPRLAPVTLVHFWATWCPPCIEEVPALERLSRDLSGRGDFAVLMIAVSDEPGKVAAFLGPAADMVLFDPKWEVANRYGTRQLPETYLVVRGRVLEKFVGSTDWDDPGIRRRIAALAGGAPAAGAASGG